jgi:hypothetical protein
MKGIVIMISTTYAKQILNALFRTGGSAGLTADAELAQLKTDASLAQFTITNADDTTQTVWGISTDRYFSAYKTDGYSSSGDATTALNKFKNPVTKSSWWTVVPYTKKHKYTVTGSSAEKEVTITGWYVKVKSEPTYPYPKDTF